MNTLRPYLHPSVSGPRYDVDTENATVPSSGRRFISEMIPNLPGRVNTSRRSRYGSRHLSARPAGSRPACCGRARQRSLRTCRGTGQPSQWSASHAHNIHPMQLIQQGDHLVADKLVCQSRVIADSGPDEGISICKKSLVLYFCCHVLLELPARDG